MERIMKLADASAEQIKTYPNVTGKDKLKRTLKQTLLGQKQAPLDAHSWPNALLGEGLLAAFEATGKKTYLDTVISYLESWKSVGYCINYVDNLMNGSLALWIEELLEGKATELYTEAEKAKIGALCGAAADACAAWAKGAKKTAEGILCYREHHPNWIFADAVGMVSPFLCRYGAVRKDEEALELGILQIDAFLKHGMDKRTGLPYHGYDEATGVKYGIIGWGRACGWLMKGLAESLVWIPSRRKEKRWLRQTFWKLKDSAARYQRPDGGFSWQLQAVDGPADVSAGAMIGNALWTTMQRSETKPDTVKFQNALADALDISINGGAVYNCSGECRGFAEYPQIYGSYPWGTGSVLRFLANQEMAPALVVEEAVDAESAVLAGVPAEGSAEEGAAAKPKKKHNNRRRYHHNGNKGGNNGGTADGNRRSEE